MAPAIPNGFPASLVAGTTWQFSIAFADFPPADGWAVSFRLVGRASGTFNATPRTATADYLVTVSATDSAAFLAGSYTWTALATLTGATYVANSGLVAVLPNPTVTGDQRTHGALLLEKVEAEILARLSGASGSAHESYTIGGRNITKISLPDLQTFRAALLAEIQKEQNGGVLPPYAITFI